MWKLIFILNKNIELNFNSIKFNSNSTIELRFNWREMGCKLVEKVLKFWMWIWYWGKKKLKKERSKHTYEYKPKFLFSNSTFNASNIVLNCKIMYF
jgi:hypothetical protein